MSNAKAGSKIILLEWFRQRSRERVLFVSSRFCFRPTHLRKELIDVGVGPRPVTVSLSLFQLQGHVQDRCQTSESIHQCNASHPNLCVEVTLAFQGKTSVPQKLVRLLGS